LIWLNIYSPSNLFHLCILWLGSDPPYVESMDGCDEALQGSPVNGMQPWSGWSPGGGPDWAAASHVIYLSPIDTCPGEVGPRVGVPRRTCFHFSVLIGRRSSSYLSSLPLSHHPFRASKVLDIHNSHLILFLNPLATSLIQPAILLSQ